MRHQPWQTFVAIGMLALMIWRKLRSLVVDSGRAIIWVGAVCTALLAIGVFVVEVTHLLHQLGFGVPDLSPLLPKFDLPNAIFSALRRVLA